MVAYCLELQMLFFNEIVLESKVLNVFGIKMRQCNSENINYSAKSVAGYDTECVPKRWFKELHNRDNTDIYKVLQIKSYSLEYFSSSESKICKRGACVDLFVHEIPICQKNWGGLDHSLHFMRCKTTDCTRIVPNFVRTILVHLFLKKRFSEYTK